MASFFFHSTLYITADTSEGINRNVDNMNGLAGPARGLFQFEDEFKFEDYFDGEL
jgi:hypothetical protein